MTDQPVLRAKMCVATVKSVANEMGWKVQEEVELRCVYGGSSDANAQWSKWTPYGEMKLSISNPGAFGKIMPGQFFFVDLVLTDKDGI
jgi:hypothetical protein